jgi:hypothetical protein
MVMDKTEFVTCPIMLELMCRQGKTPLTNSQGLLIHLGFQPTGEICQSTAGKAEVWARQHSTPCTTRAGKAARQIIIWRAMLVRTESK